MAARRELRKTSRYTRAMQSANAQQELYMNTRFKKAYPEFIRHQMFPHDTYIPEKERLQADEWPLMLGDRVQVVKPNKGFSDDRGKVGKIVHIDTRANMVFVDGLGGTKRLVVPPQSFSEGQTRPVVDVPQGMPIKNVRLVVTVPAEEDGQPDKDVAVHSLFIDKENKYYDPDYNQFLSTRVLEHDREVEIPWPRPAKLLEPTTDTELTTAAGVASERTFYAKSLVEPPVPVAALPQIRNIHSKFKRHKLITPQDILRFTTPVMPTPPAKKAYLAKAEERFGSDKSKVRPKHLDDSEFAEIEDFIGKEIEKGLERRLTEETQAYAQYQ
ncbi:uncharacterized protein SAPINGB_P000388 [Magnusiomyces paraingens]|uniref:KOW domain-containing protein n=1 Tax=Magnusiomyces paraingens TaxID=2606893 RepID=A0A5E8AYT4_9ASCO|nr:uncharacterized protein SAPINGB_P000388 [Saprochaete ingens]VVT44354.1 unnamed protein product [Saprochaete ingens]